MEVSFTIFNKKVQYNKKLHCFHIIYGYQGRRRQRISNTFTCEEFIIRLYHDLRYEWIFQPQRSFKEVTKHTCRNRELKTILEKFLGVAQAMVLAGTPAKYVKNLQKEAACVYLIHWGFPSDLQENVLSFLPFCFNYSYFDE